MLQEHATRTSRKRMSMLQHLMLLHDVRLQGHEGQTGQGLL